MADVKDGEVYVAGATQEIARRLLDAAHDLGLPSAVVRSTAGGFIVPEALVGRGESKKAAPRRKPRKSTQEGN